MQAAKLNPTQQYLWNALEDWRVENALAKIFPGSRGNFQWLIHEHFAKAKAEKVGTNPAFSILSYVLLTVRAWDVSSIVPHKEAEATIIDAHFPSIRGEIDVILEKTKNHCQSTQEAIVYALALYEILENYACDLLTKEGEQHKEKYDQLQKILHLPADKLPELMGEDLAKSIQKHGGQGSGHTLAVAIEGQKVCTQLSPEIQKEILASTTALRTRLHGLLQASVQVPCMLGRRGKVYPPKLHHLASRNPRVFMQRGQKQKVSTAVHVLLDCSGSMDGSKMELASKACYGIARALEQCRGVNVGVTAFPTYPIHKNNKVVGVYPIVKHGQKVHTRFAVKASGCTPLTEALWWSMQQMYSLKEERKIILILSDGVPDSLYTTKHALIHAQKLGFEVLALGIEDNSLEALLPKSSRCIQELGDLPRVMFEMLQKSLLRNV